MLPFKEFRKFSKITITQSQKLCNTLTEPEKKLWHHLRLRQLAGYKFRRQHPIGDYIADFACIECKLIIEIDGDSHALHPLYDKKRNALLQKHGYRILHFWNNEVMGNIEGVLEIISQSLEQTALNPHPTSPFQGEEK